MKKKILVLGTIAVDTVLNVDRLPVEDGFAAVSEERSVAGGSSANVSVALRQLGNEIFQAGRVSDDDFGNIAKADLAKNGINDRSVLISRGGVTLHTYIVVDEKGRHFIIANGGKNRTDISPEDFPTDIAEGMDVFYTDMSWPQSGISIAGRCRSAGIPVVFNLQNAPNRRTPERVEYMREMLKMTSLFITGETTVCETVETDDPEEGFHKITEGLSFPDGCILTRGKRGAVWFKGDRAICCGINEVEPVDTTGAGDAYIAGIIDSYYSSACTCEESMAFAAGVAAMKCTQGGPRLSIKEDDIRRIRRSELAVKEYQSKK